MRKTAKKLELHRETLRSLNDRALGRAAGGTWWPVTQHTFCVTDCPWCPTDTLTQASEYTLCACN